MLSSLSMEPMLFKSKSGATMSFLFDEVREKQHAILDFDAKGRLKLGKQLANQYLTKRELDILKCLIQGYSAKETGLKLGISYRTVESYINSLKLKLRCNKKRELISLAIKLGLFTLLTGTE